MAKKNRDNPAEGDPSAKPGTTEEKAKKEKRVRVEYTVPEGGLESWPTDFDPKTHKPLKRKDFKDETIWLESKAADYERRAQAMRVEIETTKTLGSSKDRAKAKKLLSMQKRMEEMQKEMEAEGIDVGALKAAMARAKDKAEGKAGAAA